MSNRIYGYLRASTDEQDANRAKEQLIEFAQSQGQQIAGWFVENESGASLKRPELFRLLDIAQQGDCLLVEQVDRISRLNGEDWESLKAIIKAKGVRIVALDLPTSHQLMTTGDEFTSRMLDALNSMMLDMLAAIARKDYTDRRRRQAQGIAKAKAEGRYKGRPIDAALHEKIQLALSAGWSYSKIEDMYKCSRATIAKVSNSFK
ncbi:recombinase family protein [Aeromonas veronii]|uniref:recombinase family protein n=1 Tax=Aeromonas veronii TaxID=654 RepID=UPI001F2EF9FB|nr:recombinase family protein [Aeromonas veronii]EKP0276777.1 recombinase family protein [Aeromonas bestiarum]MCF5914269.1 recombinase family protein [Aeromonas veronii]HDT6076793.1 recombinase family protein [Aeromonas veronii bv. veronii]